MPQLALIVARARNGAIGLRGKMPWHLPEDLKHFKETTMGSPVLMGRKTWESIGRALPGRVNIVLTRDSDYRAQGAYTATSLNAALALVPEADRVFVIGGAQLYAQTLSRVEVAWVTEIDAAPEADAFFPALPASEWTRTLVRHLDANEVRPALDFCRYERIVPLQ